MKVFWSGIGGVGLSCRGSERGSGSNFVVGLVCRGVAMLARAAVAGG